MSEKLTSSSPASPDTLTHTLLMIDQNGHVTDICVLQGDFYGFAPAEVFGRKITEFLHEGIPEPVINSCKQQFSSGYAWRGVMQCRTKDNGHCWSDVYLSPKWKAGLLHGAWVVLSTCEPSVLNRAQQIYHRMSSHACWQQRRRWQITGGLTGLALAALLLLMGAASDLALTALLGICLTLTALVLGRFSLDGASISSPTIRGGSDVDADLLMCHIYAGGSNAACRAAHQLALRELENFSLSAWMNHRCRLLENTAHHQQSRIAYLETASHQQQRQTQLIRQSLRSMLDDQHRATCAATRSLQLIQESRQDAIQARAVFHQVGQVHHQHLGRLHRIYHHLKTLISHHHQVIGLIDTLSETTEEMHFVANRHSDSDEEDSTLLATQTIHQLARSASLSLQELHSTTRQWSVTVRSFMQDIEAGIQEAQQLFSFVCDGDSGQQSVINLMDRLAALTTDIEGALHQQSIARAAVVRHTEILEEHISHVARTSRDIGAGIERAREQLDCLRRETREPVNH